MDILLALKQEESKLKDRLKGVQGAIVALNGTSSSTPDAGPAAEKRAAPKRKMSAAARAKISKATKARWANFRAEKLKKGK